MSHSSSAPTSREASLFLPELRPYQRELFLDPKRRSVTLSAPQIGKTLALVCWLLAYAWQNPGRLYWWAAPTYRQVRPGFDLFVELAQSAGVLASKTTSSGDVSIRLVNGSRIEFVSWDEPENLTGPTVYAMVVDEAHELTALAWRLLKTRLSSSLGPVRVIGNTGDVEGEFKRICDEADDPANADIYSFRTWTYRHKLAALGGEETAAGAEYAAFVEEERRTMLPADFESVYLAKWLKSVSAVFTNVDEATTLVPWCCPFPGVPYVAGVDVGEETDYTVVLPIPVMTAPELRAMERWRGLDGPTAVDRLEGIAEHWNDALLVVEVNGMGRYYFQELRRRGVRVWPWTTVGGKARSTPHQPIKADAVSAAAGDVHWGRVKLAPLPPLQAELKAYRRRRLPSGGWEYRAREGVHDDCTMSFVIGNASRRIAEAYRPTGPRRVRVA